MKYIQLYFYIIFFSISSLSVESFAQNFTPEERHKIENFDFIMTEVTTPQGLEILKSKSENINLDDTHLPQLISHLLYMVEKEDGVGIAAPQLGVNKNVFIMQRFDNDNFPFDVVINPRILWTSELYELGPEGCLSIPNFRKDIWRHYAIMVEYYNIKKEKVVETLEGYTAKIFQHEFDHLQGLLITDSVHLYNDQIIEVISGSFGKIKD